MPDHMAKTAGSRKPPTRPVFDAARRASVEFLWTPGVPTRSAQHESERGVKPSRMRPRSGAEPRAGRAPSMASGVDGAGACATRTIVFAVNAFPTNIQINGHDRPYYELTQVNS